MATNRGVVRRVKGQPKTLFDYVEKVVTDYASSFVKSLGPILVLGLYAILSLHIYCFFWLIVPVLKKRLGTYFGLTWIAIGLSLVYNITFNHLMAVMIKPTGPKDLKMIETMR